MLLLSRKLGEAIAIGGDVSIKVMRITPQRVLLGVDAPDDVPIHRDEVAQAILGAGESIQSLAQRRKWLHVWEQGEYKGSTPCNNTNIAALMKPEDCSYRGVFYQLTNSPNCPTA